MSESPQPIAPMNVIVLASEVGVPSTARPALAQLRIEDGRAAVGWLSTANGSLALDLEVGDEDPWPVGQLDLIGTLVPSTPETTDRPYLNLQDHIIAVYASSLALPSRRALATCTWSPRASRIDLMPPGPTTRGWSQSDLEATGAALRWLETLARPGGPSAMSDAEAFEQAVQFGLEWLNDNPIAEPSGFTFEQLRLRRCTGPDALKKWLKTKHFGIRRVQQELVKRRIRRPE